MCVKAAKGFMANGHNPVGNVAATATVSESSLALFWVTNPKLSDGWLQRDEYSVVYLVCVTGTGLGSIEHCR